MVLADFFFECICKYVRRIWQKVISFLKESPHQYTAEFLSIIRICGFGLLLDNNRGESDIIVNEAERDFLFVFFVGT